MSWFKKTWEFLKNKKTYLTVGGFLSWKIVNAFINTGVTQEQETVIDLAFETLMGYGLFDKLRRNEKENNTIGKTIENAGKIFKQNRKRD